MSKWWEGYDWRFIQTNLREVDMAGIDARRYAADMRSFHATVAMINAAGIIASYETKLPYHYQSRFLTGDSLKDIIDECHKQGIKVVARTDFSKIRRSIYEEHPAWAYRKANGDIVDFEGDVHACINGAYQSEYALLIIKECLELYDFDGIFFNMGGYQVRDYAGVYHGICHCEGCKRRFMELYGLELPDKEDMGDPVYRKYRLFRNETSAAHNEKVARFIKSLRPDILINHDTYTESTGMIRQESNTALDRALPHWQYSGSENTKWVRSSYEGYISSNCSVDFIDFPVRHTAVSPTQQQTRLWQNLANGGQLDYYLIGRLDDHQDRSGYDGIKSAFAYHKEHQALYRDTRSIAGVALVTPSHWGGFGDQNEAAGLYRMLAEGHYLFDVVLQNRLADVDLAKYHTLVLPGLTALGDAEAAIIDAFVSQGGNVFCTGQTGFLDGDAEKRKLPALACLGVTNIGITQNARGAYFQISETDRSIFHRFTDAELVFIDGDYTYAEYDKDITPVLRMIPPQPFGPPERCYPLYPAGESPAAILRSFGKGKCAYLPWNPGALFHRQGYPNTMDFVLDVLENALGVSPMKTDAPPMVETTLLSITGTDDLLLHFVNQTGHFGNSFYPPVTIPSICCSLPLDKPPAAATSLVSRKDIPFSYSDGKLLLTAEQVGIFEAIHLRFI